METLRRWIYPLCAVALTCGWLLAPADLTSRGGAGGPVATGPGGYTTRATGEVDGNTSAEQMPSVEGKLVRFKAADDNTGSVFIGTSTNMTVKDGTTDTTTGFQLTAGQDTGWVPVQANLNEYWHRESNATDDFTYWVLN